MDVFTFRTGVYKLYPVDYSTKFFPEWWKKLPKEYMDKNNNNRLSSTMKRCEGFIDYYKNSISIPLWSDLALNIRSEFNTVNWDFSDMITSATTHPWYQMEGLMRDQQFSHIKINSVWNLKTKEDIYWTWSQPMWNFDDPFTIIVPPAVINFKYQHSTNINIFIKTSIDKFMILPVGMPMANLTPITEKEVVLHRHLISEKEYHEMDDISYANSFTHKYRNAKKILQEKESKCPFHFK